MATRYSITATAQTIELPSLGGHYSFKNNGTGIVYYRAFATSAYTGNAATLQAASDGEIESGEVVHLPPDYARVQVVCATSATATLLLAAGEVDTTSAASAGDATAANQTAANALLTTIDADTSSIDATMQAVAMDSGATDANTQRIILASDDPAVTKLGTIDAALGGSIAPTVDSVADAVVDCGAGATVEVIATPGASKQLWILGLMGTANTVDTTIVLKSASTAKSGTMPMADNGGFVLPTCGNLATPWVKCATNEAFQITTATGTFDGIVVYAIVSV